MVLCAHPSAPAAPRSFVKFPFHRFRANVPPKGKSFKRAIGPNRKTFDSPPSSSPSPSPLLLPIDIPILARRHRVFENTFSI